MPAVDGAAIHHHEEDPVRVLVEDARRRVVAVLAQRVGELAGRSARLLGARDRLPPDRAVRPLRVHQRGVLWRRFDPEPAARRLEPGPLFRFHPDEALELCRALALVAQLSPIGLSNCSRTHPDFRGSRAVSTKCTVLKSTLVLRHYVLAYRDLNTTRYCLLIHRDQLFLGLLFSRTLSTLTLCGFLFWAGLLKGLS